MADQDHVCSLVIAGPDPAIHPLRKTLPKMMDARIKSGHDMRVEVALLTILSPLLHIATNGSHDDTHSGYAFRAAL
ncbi:hypothetical protein ACFIOY_09160 [Bradyrhizobium sp. TZ2]